MYRPLREQARLLHWFVVQIKLRVRHDSVGAELAREGVSTFNFDVECTGLFASKLGSYRRLRSFDLTNLMFVQ
jgi:hypothetical protein